ncbi:hypothetical protein AK830_g3204 [Neonectria ditissima]|uniref:Aminoglycoside phosphotransferase domain-containing protein n=1 Tax=Neonectria ditissima TaxID=78410 RepID=A0A0P7BCN5_9HYPO|nr:hypothetical protein AK830_g3204 [Neonectria ditissima]
MSMSLPPRNGGMTLEEALAADDDVILELSYSKQQEELFEYLRDSRTDIENAVSRHLGLSTSERCQLSERDEWMRGNFNLCIPVYLENWSRRTGKRVVIRFPLPYKLGEADFPGNVEEKLRCEAATFIWIQEHCPETGYLVMEYVEESRGKPLARLWTDLDSDHNRRRNFFADLSRIMLAFSRTTFSNICSPTIDDEGVLHFRNRPLTFRLQQMENKGIPLPIERATTYPNVDAYLFDLQCCHDARIRHQRNSIRNRSDAEMKISVLAALRALTPHFFDRDLRNGPFVFMLTDIHPNNIFVDDEWHITCLIDLEWACVRPIEMLLPPVWFTGRRVDQLPKDQHLDAYSSVLDEFAQSFEEEASSIPIKSTALLSTQLLRSTLDSGRFWYYHALDNPKVANNLFFQHIWPRFNGGLGVLEFTKSTKTLTTCLGEEAKGIIVSKLAERENAEMTLEKSSSALSVLSHGAAGSSINAAESLDDWRHLLVLPKQPWRRAQSVTGCLQPRPAAAMHFAVQHLRVVPMAASLDIPREQQASLLLERASGRITTPGLHLDTVKYRKRPSSEAQAVFRVKLLEALRSRWADKDTESKFLETVERVESDGCAIIGALVDKPIFENLIAGYSRMQRLSGNHTFLHSYVNLAQHPDFITGGEYSDAFAHPLLVALIAYLMGGGQEYKILVNWHRGAAKGPSGQNFTFLPGTNKGNRDVLLDDSGHPWSTERDSLFVTNDAIDGLFDFQIQTGRPPSVIEVAFPDQPLSIVFPAGALVHHRHRTKQGNPRSCIIAAFHLCSANPGALVKTLVEFLISPQDGNSTAEFLELLSAKAATIENKLAELFQSSHPTTLVDIAPLTLTDEKLAQWRGDVVEAPTPTSIKLARDVYLSKADFGNIESLANTVASVMMYDKHGLLQLILYEDGREEIRKPARKLIGEMKHEQIVMRLKSWLRSTNCRFFSLSDLPSPSHLKEMGSAIAGFANDRINAGITEKDAALDLQRLVSLHRLMIDIFKILNLLASTSSKLAKLDG